MHLTDIRVSDKERYGASPKIAPMTSATEKKRMNEKRGPTIYLDGVYLKKIALPEDCKAGDYLNLTMVVKVKRYSSTDVSTESEPKKKTEESMELEIHRMGIDDELKAGTRAAAWNDTEGEEDAGDDDED